MVFYRKYRPQTIDELDSEDVKKTLSSVLAHDTIPHAFLFTGPKGLGKTSTARIVAKYVNCEQGVKSNDKKGKTSNKSATTIPCNMCESCVSITDGTNFDVLEIDGASNRGIDEIRDLREKIRLLPVAAVKKVYIIDEVHMLTTEAFNALLKTLEEPPAHAMFILATTESHKVPATILSRCFHIAFKKASAEDLVHSFRRIIQAEKIDVDGEVLSTIASFADGSFRDGAKILEEIVIASQGKKITTDMLGSLYHTQNIEGDIVELLTAFQENDKKKGLALVQRLVIQGTDMKYFLEHVLLYLHTQLLIQIGLVSEKAKLPLDLAMLKALVAVFSKAHGEIKTAVLPQLPLELAIVEWVGVDEEKEEKGNKNVVGKKEEPSTVRSQPIETTQSSQEIPTSAVTPRTDIKKTTSHDDKTFLHQVLDSIKAEHHMLAGVLRSCTIRVEGDVVIIEAPSSFHKQRLDDKKALEILEKVYTELSGNKGTISVVVKK